MPKGIGTFLIAQWLPQFHRAIPSAALDESLFSFMRLGYMIAGRLSRKKTNRVQLCLPDNLLKIRRRMLADRTDKSVRQLLAHIFVAADPAAPDRFPGGSCSGAAGEALLYGG